MVIRVLFKIHRLDKIKSINKINIGIKNVARRDGNICTPGLLGEESKRLWMNTQTLHYAFLECNASMLMCQASLYGIVANQANCFPVRG